MPPPGVTPLADGDPHRVGPFHVRGRLGAGGMGVVYAAVAPDGTRVAVKQIRAEYAADAAFRSRFAREVALMSRVTGPCLVPLLDADPNADRPWLATPYIPGIPLDRYIAEHGPLPGALLIALAVGTAAALAAVHAAGVIHRDFKPSNIILGPGGPHVLDFGIAHAADGTAITRTGLWTGTPGWTSPEQYLGAEGDWAADVFTWGATIAFAATGRQPFGNGRPDAIAYRITHGDADLNGVPEELLPHVQAALSKEPDLRPPAAGLAEHISAALAGQQTAVLSSPPTRVMHASADIGSEIRDAWSLAASAPDGPWGKAPVPGRGRLYAAAAILLVAAAAAVSFWPAGALAAHPAATGATSSPQHLSATSSATAAPPPSSLPSADVSTGTLLPPAVFAGLIRDDNNTVVQSIQAKVTSGLVSGNATPVVTGYSSSVGDRVPKVIVIGAYGRFAIPALQLNTVWTAATSGGNSVTGTINEDPGSLGGTMQCGLVQENGLYFPTCAWADDTTLAMIMDSAHLYDSTTDLSAWAAPTRELRAQMEGTG